ncbi:hypothetical protein N9068_00345 [bacterium]|nr:hypothetical protein [bacterium]
MKMPACCRYLHWNQIVKTATVFFLTLISCFTAEESRIWGQAKTAITKTPPNVIRIEGMVTERKKYSIRVKQGEQEFDVKLTDGVAIALKMNRPWYDWKNKQVVVDAIDENVASADSKRVGVPLPAQKLFLISRLGNAKTMQATMAKKVKRLNFYLVTPEDTGHHQPTADEPFLSGELFVENDQPYVIVNDEKISVMLGFRFATMNGFSINQLKPNQTQVFLTGTRGKNEQEILTSRILFQPVQKKTSKQANVTGQAIKIANDE